MTPVDVFSSQLEEYWNDSPGCRTGCAPTTPGRRISSVWPAASVMIQCRPSSCTVSSPSFVMRTV
jgi:hypothetical protein